jgi:hypothetical protein
MSPFALALGADFEALPQVVRRFHDGTARQWRGVATITHGQGVLARLGIRLGGFPKPGREIPFTISVSPEGATERWTRNFDGHILRSTLRYDPIHDQVQERFGPITCAMSLHRRGDTLQVRVAGMWVFGVPIPMRLVPRSDAVEGQTANNAFAFDIGASLPGGAPLIRYRGEVTQV